MCPSGGTLMSSVTAKASSATLDRRTAPADRRWLVLVVAAVAQLMLVLDATIVNIALPSAQQALGFSNSDRQWVVTAYALAFGSLLLVGGRLGDIFSRKWVFITSLVGFAIASAIGGAAGSFAVLVTARALQGAFGAVLAPAALGTLVSTFTDPSERGRAFGVFGSVAAGGSAVGLILGGVRSRPPTATRSPSAYRADLRDAGASTPASTSSESRRRGETPVHECVPQVMT